MATPAPFPPLAAARRDTRLNRPIRLPGLVTGLLLVIVLYFGKPVLMPFALAALFSFLLNLKSSPASA